MSDRLANLSGSSITSPRTRLYNCIAFAAGETHRWWWPVAAYWPAGIPNEETIDAFVAAFGTLGYSTCEDGNLETGFVKVAIYVDQSGTPTHMARQLISGKWTSKCGSLEDIEHDTLEILGDLYGVVTQFLRRPLSE
jgi:hypothetical protein